VSPESAEGGAIGLVRDGDAIRIDIPNRKLDLLVSEAEMAARRAAFTPQERKVASPVLRRYARAVTSASRGAVLE
jgi:dihydroxy-acid dehydratase